MSNFGQIAGGLVGAVVGYLVGGPQGALYGFEIGLGVGSIISPTQLPGQTGPRLTDHVTTTSSLGDPLPQGWGTFAVNGTVMWIDDIVEHSQTTTQGGKGTPTQDVTTFSYTQSIAIGLHYGEILDVLRIWENGELVYDKRPQQDGESDVDYAKRVGKTAVYAETFVLYYGTEDQLPDATIELDQGIGNVPPFLGLAYIVYPDRALRQDQALRHPSFKFELVTAATRSKILINHTYLSGGFHDHIQLNTLAVDWIHGRYYTKSVDIAGDDMQYIMGFTIENNTEFAERAFATIADDNIENLAANPYTGDLFVCTANFSSGFLYKLDPVTLETEQVIELDDFASNFLNVGFGQTIDYTGSLNNVMLWIPAVWDNRLEYSSCDVLNWTPGITEFIFPGTKIVFCTGRKEGNVCVWWVASFTASISGTNTGIDWYKVTYTPALSFTDPAEWSAEYISTTAPSDIEAARTRVAEVSGLTFDSSDGHLLFTVTVGGTSAPDVASWAVKVNQTSGAVQWTTTLPLIAYDYASNSGSVTNNRWYLVSGTSSVKVFNTQDGSTTLDSFSAEMAAAGVGTLEGSYSSNTPVGGGVVTHSATGPVVLYVGKLTGGDVLVSDIVHDICDKATLTENDVSTMDGTTVHGYVLQTPTVTARDAISPLRSVAFFDAVEHGETLRFVTRGGESIVTLTNADLGAYETDTTDDPDANNTSGDTLETDLPMQVRVRYVSVERSYQDGEQLSLARYDTDATQVVDAQLPVCLNDDQAAQIAEILWNQAWQRRRTFSFTLDVSKSYLETTDPVLVPLKNTLMRAMITQIDDASQILRKVTAISDDDGIYVSSAVAQPAPPQTTMVFYSESVLQLMDTPLLRDRDDTARVTAPLYSALAPNGADVWRGAQIYDSTDGLDYAGVNSGNLRADMGVLATQLSGVDDPYLTDDTNTVQITFDVGAALPSSITDTALFAGGNAAVVIAADGSVEVFQFRDVTPVSGQTITVSHLLRGRRGTDTMAAANRAAGSRVVMLSVEQLQVTDMDLLTLDTTLYWKAATFSTSVADANSQSFQDTGRSLMPYAPVNLHAIPAGSPPTGIEIHAKRRARIGAAEWFDGETDDLPLAEDFERYEMDVYSGTSIIRTITSDSLPVVYENADIITDFGLIPVSVKVALYQISHQVGRGFAKVQTLEVE